MTVESLLPALPFAATAVGVFRHACSQVSNNNLFRHNRVRAVELLRGLDDSPLRVHFNEVQMEAGRRMSQMIKAPISDAKDKSPERMPNAETQRSVFERDGWRCRWCTTQIISPSANRYMSSKFPDAYPGGPRNIDYHGLILCAQGSIDHVMSYSLGGTNDLHNLITACWPCQFARGEIDFALLGLSDPRLREPILDDWDGCKWFQR